MNFFPHAKSRHGSPLSHPSCRRSAQAQDSRASYFHHPKSKIQNLKFGESAFSLTEVVIAMGVAAVAFTSIIALFPLGLNMSKESYEATQAALIAQSILADLRDQNSSTSGKLIQKSGTNAMTNANYEIIPMTGTSGPLADRYIYLAYDQQIRSDSSNNPIMLRPRLSSTTELPWFTKGTNGPILLVKVSIKNTFRMSATGKANPQRVDVTVESPANVPATNRVQYIFSGVIPQT